jgi:hypothetical protein
MQNLSQKEKFLHKKVVKTGLITCEQKMLAKISQ